MDERWYNKRGENDDVILVSRIRLLRNFEGYKFPEMMTDEERTALLATVSEKLSGGMEKAVSSEVHMVTMDALKAEEKAAFYERLLINKATLLSDRPYAVYASADEAFSMTINGRDHVRMLLSMHGQNLPELMNRLDGIDEFVNARMPYAYSDEFGFKTANIADVGTGMRAYYVIHLPLLSEEKNFTALVREISRYGVVIKDAWNIGKNRVGSLYVLYNQRTFGLQESNIIEILTSVANRLMEEERTLRKARSPLAMRDRVMRSYGILKYAARMELHEACAHLSNMLLGVSLGILTVRSDLSVYELLLGILPGNLQVFYHETFDENTMKIRRADYLRLFMQEIEPASEGGR